MSNAFNSIGTQYSYDAPPSTGYLPLTNTDIPAGTKYYYDAPPSAGYAPVANTGNSAQMQYGYGMSPGNGYTPIQNSVSYAAVPNNGYVTSPATYTYSQNLSATPQSQPAPTVVSPVMNNANAAAVVDSVTAAIAGGSSESKANVPATAPLVNTQGATSVANAIDATKTSIGCASTVAALGSGVAIGFGQVEAVPVFEATAPYALATGANDCALGLTKAYANATGNIGARKCHRLDIPSVLMGRSRVAILNVEHATCFPVSDNGHNDNAE